jgi:hypothetical protein
MTETNYDKLIWENNTFPDKIKDDEDIVLVCREDLVILGTKFLFLLVLFLSVLALRILVAGQSNLFWISFYDVAMYCFSTVLLLIFTLAFHNYYLSIQIVTSDRIIDIDQRGIFNREVNEVMLENIEDVSYKQKTFFSLIFNFGNVVLQSSGTDNPGNPATEDKINGFVFNNVPDPKAIASKISVLIQENQRDNLEDAAKYNAKYISEALNKKP